MRVPLLSFLQKVPGGMLVVPLLAMALVNTAAPGLFAIGDPTTALFTGQGTMVLVGMILFIAGTHLRVAALARVAVRGVVLLAAKLLLGFAAAALVLAVWGPAGFAGVSVVAVAVALASGNEGVYLSLVSQYGTPDDIAAAGILNLVTVPAVPVAVLCASSGVPIDWMGVWAGLVPFLLGCVLANLDPRFGEMMGHAMAPALFFIGGMFGSNINLLDMLAAGPQGLLLSALFLAVEVPLFFALDRYVLRGKGYAGVAYCEVAGMTVVIPSLVGQALPQYAPYVAAATSQLTMAIIVTCAVTPFVTRACVKRFGGGVAAAVDAGEGTAEAPEAA